jgi:hypothetical protein
MLKTRRKGNGQAGNRFSMHGQGLSLLGSECCPNCGQKHTQGDAMWYKNFDSSIPQKISSRCGQEAPVHWYILKSKTTPEKR